MATDTEIFKAAIQQAIENGWQCPSLIKAMYTGYTADITEGHNVEMVRGVITGHDFARALWADGTLIHTNEVAYDETGSEYTVTIPTWQWHLQQMVVADNPIQYLGEHLSMLVNEWIERYYANHGTFFTCTLYRDEGFWFIELSHFIDKKEYALCTALDNTKWPNIDIEQSGLLFDTRAAMVHEHLQHEIKHRKQKQRYS